MLIYKNVEKTDFFLIVILKKSQLITEIRINILQTIFQLLSTDSSLTYKGFDLWERLKAFNDSFTIWHLESISLLSAMIQSIETNGKDIFSVKQDQFETQNQIDPIEHPIQIANPFQEPLTSNLGENSKRFNFKWYNRNIIFL